MQNAITKDRLRITEIFYSLQGEARNVGIPTVFVRLTGCPLRCQYCDTEYAFTGGEWMDFSAITEEIRKYQTNYVTVTGGEPLAQPNCIALLQQLCDAKYDVSLETSGAISLDQVDVRVKKIMDIKTPASGECERNHWQNLSLLDHQDQLKFVICNEEDYLWSREQVVQRELDKICEVLFSPSYEQIDSSQLAAWILRDQLPVRFQLQLHKILWGSQAGK